MPFKSKAQRRKFAQLLVEGKITDEQYEEWNRSTGRQELPERLADARPTTKRAPAKRKATRKSSNKSAARTAARTSPTRKAVKRAVRKSPARRKLPKSST